MPKVKLNQGGAYQICGIRLESGFNEVSDADYSVLKSQGGFLNDVKHGLIEIEEPAFVLAEEAPKRGKPAKINNDNELLG